MLGYRDDELENSFGTWESNLHPEDRAKTIEYLNDFLPSSATRYEIKFRMQQKDGEYLPILARAKKIFDESGKAIRLIGTHVDISEITKAQESLKYQALHDSLTNLPNQGIQIAIDDFGTGYSSLAYLKQLPIHKLKIDKSFVDDIVSNSDSQVIVKTIISMAKNMNLKLIAEGVETQEQKELLVKNGCQEIQGYYYHKPMSQEGIEKLIL